jgi:ATP-dependent RNA helicase DDX46/PRP5
MVATSLCARGLDISHIKLVVNYCCPNHMEDYVHRVGRTGRAGEQGTAITFITPEECQYAQDLIMALENSNKQVPESLRELHEEYKQKVQDGEIEKRRANIGFVGKGFKFDASEENQIKEFRMELSKEYGFAVDNEKDEADFDNKNDQDKETREKQEQYQLIKLLDRDDQARRIALEAGNKASNEALKQGIYTPEEVAEIAKQEMIRALKEFKPANVTVERAIDKAAKIRD